MASATEKKFWLEFIELYKSKPEIWKIKSEIYKDRIFKNSAYDDLVQKLKEVIPEANRDLVRKKINSFRSSYRRELKRVKESEKSGASPDDVYIPTLWLYDHLSFLRDQEDQLEGTSTMDSSDENTKGDKTISVPGKRRQTAETSTSTKELLQRACDHLKQSNDESEIMGRCWAFKYKDLSKDQKLFARKAIDDILFEAQLGTLHRNSVKINESQSTQHILVPTPSPASTFSYISSPTLSTPSPINTQTSTEVGPITGANIFIQSDSYDSVQDLFCDTQYQ